jgi:uncharacterized protein YdhG (YjbR/CyaY superfamily)
MPGSRPLSIDGYLETQPPAQRERLETLRRHIQKIVPEAEETISYSMPAFRYKKRVMVFFAGWSSHVGIYPVPQNSPQLIAELEPWRDGKGTLRFPLDTPLPFDLISRVVMGLKSQIDEKAQATKTATAKA